MEKCTAYYLHNKSYRFLYILRKNNLWGLKYNRRTKICDSSNPELLDPTQPIAEIIERKDSEWLIIYTEWGERFSKKDRRGKVIRDSISRLMKLAEEFNPSDL